MITRWKCQKEKTLNQISFVACGNAERKVADAFCDKCHIYFCQTRVNRYKVPRSVRMGDDVSSVLSYINAESREKAITTVLGDLKLNSDLTTNWKILYHLLSSVGQIQQVSSSDIVEVCLTCLNRRDPTVSTRLVCQILITLIEKVELDEIEPKLSGFLEDVQSNIIWQCNLHQMHDNCGMDYQTATTVFSLVLPTFVKHNLIKNPSRLFEVLPAMIHSRNENSIVEALVFVLPSVIHHESLFQVVCQSVQSLFESEEELDKLSNHPGLTALCSIGDFLFSGTFNHKVFRETWFQQAIQRGLSNPAALNRKRAQYLLKRYVDATAENVQLFNDFFLVMETLEEKQMHIINPVLTRMESLEDRILIKKEADSAWICCIFNRLLSHENIQVIKWGLHQLCRIQVQFWPGIGHSEWLYDGMLTALNNMVFYVREKAGQLPPLARDLEQFLAKCAALTEESQAIFLRLLRKMSAIPWNAVGLFHLVHALASIHGVQLLDSQALQLILEFCRSGLHTHHPLLRGAIQGLMLEFVLNAAVVSQDNLLWVALILATLDSRECYIRGSHPHRMLQRWISKHFTPEQHGQLLSQLVSTHFDPSGDVRTAYSVDVTAVARFAVLLIDIQSNDEMSSQSIYARLEPLTDCHTRLYADPRLLDQRMKLMANLLDEIRSSKTVRVVQIVLPFTESVIHYCLDRIETAADYTSVCQSLSVLESIAETEELVGVLAASGQRLQLAAQKLLDGSLVLDRFKSISLLFLIVRFDQQFVDNLIRRMIIAKMHCKAPQRDDSGLEHVTWGAFMSHYFSKLWTLIHRRLEILGPQLNPEELADEATCAMDMAGVEAVKSIFACLAFLLPRVCQSAPQLCRSTLQSCWSVCFEFRRSDHFWSLMEQLTKTAFQRSLMDQSQIRPQFFGFLSELRQQGENILQLFNFAADQVIRVWIDESFPSIDSYTVQFVVDLVTFGQIHRRDEM